MIIKALLERRRQQMDLLYHGTSSVHLRSILKNGLMANPPETTYGGSGDTTFDFPVGYETFGGVYLTNSLVKAKNAAHSSVSRFGGEPIVVAVNYVIRSGEADEDMITDVMVKDIRFMLENFWETDQEEYDSFTEYEQNNREEVLENLMSSAMEHFNNIGFPSPRFESLLREAYTYILDYVDEEHLDGLIMAQLRHDFKFTDLIESMMRELRINHHGYHDFSIRVVRDIGFRGKTRIHSIFHADTSEFYYKA